MPQGTVYVTSIAKAMALSCNCDTAGYSRFLTLCRRIREETHGARQQMIPGEGPVCNS